MNAITGSWNLNINLPPKKYDEYIQIHNDAFLVTVDGVVVSLLPDVSEIVGVKSINLNANRDLFLGDDEDIDPSDTRAQQVEYDGTTIRLKMHVLVSPGSTYPVRLLVADISDRLFDSALFIARDSLRSVPVVP